MHFLVKRSLFFKIGVSHEHFAINFLHWAQISPHWAIIFQTIRSHCTSISSNQTKPNLEKGSTLDWIIGIATQHNKGIQVQLMLIHFALSREAFNRF